MKTPARLLLIVCVALLTACATLPPGKRDPRDPWERMNRATFRFNDGLDRKVLQPVARGYRKVTPGFVRTGIHNFFDNIDYPIVMLNDLLQGQLKAFANDTGRFVLNTTVGLGGLLDPATAAGLDRNDRDLGQTLGKWGMHKGPYVVLPFFGPSDVRDSFGRLGDAYSTPRMYIHNRWWNWGLWGLQKVDWRASVLDTTRLLEETYDPYAFLRNAYLQNRDFKVKGSEADDHEEQMLQDAGLDDDADAAKGSHAPPQPPQPPQPPPRQ
ncbi:MAG: VacJ family lipoprotein [Proteobacteria bacterium]|nr:VacJ family lipoprotein [Pseudomonadota bacterium]